jgi:hypothetical protein
MLICKFPKKKEPFFPPENSAWKKWFLYVNASALASASVLIA